MKPRSAARFGISATRVIVLIPTRGSIASELARALINNTEEYELELFTVDRQPVDVARNQLAAMAIDAADDIARFSRDDDPYVFWIDSDAFFIKGTLSLMMAALDRNPAISLLAGLFGPRAANAGATAFRDRHDRKSFLMPDVNVQRGDIVEVDVVGMHMVVHRVSLLRSVGAHPFGVEDDQISEDAAFCGRVQISGGTIAVATGVPVFHVDEKTGIAYTPGMPPCAIAGDQIDLTFSPAESEVESRTYGMRIDAIVNQR